MTEPTVIIEFFAAARDLAGTPQSPLTLPPGSPQTAGSALDAACSRWPRLRPYRDRLRVAVDGEIVALDAAVRDGSVIALLPPVAGGAPHGLVELREAAIDPVEAIEAVRHAGAGGVDVFLGYVRDHADGKAVARLEYEAHPALALAEMRRIAAAVEAEIPGVRIACLHRTGTLAVGDLAVVVAASAAHRAEAFTACRAVIERVKERVPIWKKEWAPDGSAIWVNLDPKP
ncbi:MAG: molybdenum cofactor biosynthesis protein MoaE [Deltaproteobacteria bacterium]|nr:molybdenum cofactor biosynthesis protein MoaE [Deltaproteobacteria bacterium]